MFIGDSINLRKKYHINKYNYMLLQSLTVWGLPKVGHFSTAVHLKNKILVMHKTVIVARHPAFGEPILPEYPSAFRVKWLSV